VTAGAGTVTAGAVLVQGGLGSVRAVLRGEVPRHGLQSINLPGRRPYPLLGRSARSPSGPPWGASACGRQGALVRHLLTWRLPDVAPADVAPADVAGAPAPVSVPVPEQAQDLAAAQWDEEGSLVGARERACAAAQGASAPAGDQPRPVGRGEGQPDAAGVPGASGGTTLGVPPPGLDPKGPGRTGREGRGGGRGAGRERRGWVKRLF